jgi:hypothetical protein
MDFSQDPKIRTISPGLKRFNIPKHERFSEELPDMCSLKSGLNNSSFLSPKPKFETLRYPNKWTEERNLRALHTQFHLSPSQKQL